LEERGAEKVCSAEEVIAALRSFDAAEVLVEGGGEETKGFAEYVLKRGGEPVAVILLDRVRGEIPQARIRCGKGWLVYGLVPRRSRDGVPYTEYSWLIIDTAGAQRRAEFASEEIAEITTALKEATERVLKK